MKSNENYLDNHNITANGMKRAYPTEQKQRSTFNDLYMYVRKMSDCSIKLDRFMKGYEKASDFYMKRLSRRKHPETLAVARVENAAMTAVGNDLPEGCTTVGSLTNTTHIKPSKLGAKVRATAVLKEIDGRKLTFNITAEDDNGIIGEGEHVRFIVDIERFISKLK